MSLLLAAAASISLLVGGIGIMNILLIGSISLGRLICCRGRARLKPQAELIF